MSSDSRHANSQYDSYKKADSDWQRQNFLDWKERMYRNEDLFEGRKTQAQIDHEENLREIESVKNFIEMSHRNPEWHTSYLFKELEWEIFCLMNKLPYSPSHKEGVPGYWEYRELKAPEWLKKTRQRLRNE